MSIESELEIEKVKAPEGSVVVSFGGGTGVSPVTRVCTFRSEKCIPERSKSDIKAADFCKIRVPLHKMSLCYTKMSLFFRANCRRFICFHTHYGFERS